MSAVSIGDPNHTPKLGKSGVEKNVKFYLVYKQDAGFLKFIQDEPTWVEEVFPCHLFKERKDAEKMTKLLKRRCLSGLRVATVNFSIKC